MYVLYINKNGIFCQPTSIINKKTELWWTLIKTDDLALPPSSLISCSDGIMGGGHTPQPFP